MTTVSTQSSPDRQSGAALLQLKRRIQGQEVGWTPSETTVRNLTRRRRRKAGSGPPADALIAWIGTDPYLRDAITTASHRREYCLPLPYRSRSAAAAMAICLVLACGAAAGIIQIISHGRASQPPITRPLVAGKERTAARHDNKRVSSTEALPVLSAGGASPPSAHPTPAAMAPMLVEPRKAPESKPVPTPTSDAATISSAPDPSVVPPTIGDIPTDHSPYRRPVSTAPQVGQPLDPRPPDPADQPSATGLPQHATATDESDHTGASQPPLSDRRSVIRLGSNGFQGAPSRLAARTRTGEPTSRARSNRSARTALTAH